VLLFVAVLRAVAAQPFFIPSASMDPQLRVHDRIVVSRMSYRLHDPRRGDVVVFSEPPAARAIEGDTSEQGPSNPFAHAFRSLAEAVGVVQPSTQDWVKRVVGLPGDRVEGIAGSVYVNGHLLVEPYLPRGTVTQPFPAVVVPPESLWVMGDNRGDSLDSRVFGTIARSSLVGRTFVRIWPLWHASFL
jgi:signal peptidase I